MSLLKIIKKYLIKKKLKVEEDSEGFSAVSYAKANVLLAEAIKELTQEMRNEIFELKTRIFQLEYR